ncbi:sensor domain-containing diguanylate cyclase [Diplocloster agilis]|uniref:Diguanylate cyclase n=1 Tax=Diplocloster agilis TaxID=2850323 RepID=A0A949NIB0_9FIRM|nr:diguanylate cyclase [Diplocloster agilis]MBU9739728.1 diguanylate cyclase [Diplocloster agilis]
MKSIKYKIVSVLFTCILITALATGSAGIISAGKVVDTDTTRIMGLYCSDKAQSVNSILKHIQQSVQMVSDYAVHKLDDVPRFQTDEAYVNAFTQTVNDVLLNSANHTEGAIAAYIRYNPDFTAPTSGLFYTRQTVDGEFESTQPTDFSKYAEDDVERVGWYYIPISNNSPTWLPPYLNQNINVQMISYIIPIQIDGVNIGVVGMDINFDVLKTLVDSTQIFKTGYAFLTDSQSDIIYHHDYVMHTALTDIDSNLNSLAAKLQNQSGTDELISYTYHGEKKKASFQELANGMKLVLTAPVKELNATRTDLIIQILLITIGVSLITLLFSYLLAKRMARPLIELNVAAKKIADGDLGITISHHSKDEIGTLAESFRKTVSQLNEYISYIKGLAYRDPITGVKSKTAYVEAVKNLESRMQIEQPSFAVAVFDINNLKRVNDEYGHDMGDMQIIAACKIICKVFSHSPVYRIGGDEFVVILTDQGLIDCLPLLDQFKTAIKEHNRNIQGDLVLQIARGIAVYDSAADLSYNDVFKRADTAMYHNKNVLKSQQQPC